MRSRVLCFFVVVFCFGASLTPAVGAQTDPSVAQETTTTVPPTTTTTTTAAPPTTVAPAPAPTGPTPEQVSAFRRALAPAGSGAGRRIVYSNAFQRVWLINDAEEVEKTYLVSGRKGMPRAGMYRVFSKSMSAGSGSARMQYMIRFAKGSKLAIGFHTIPTGARGRPLQTVAQLGTYRSHGCVRQSIPDAQHLWMWAPVGTLVVVLP